MNRSEVDVVINLRSLLGEGPQWDHRTGVLAWVDILGGFVHLTDPHGGITRSIPVGPGVGAVAPHGEHGYLLAVRNGFATLTAGHLEVTHELFDEPGVRMNDGAVDPGGRFVAGSMAGDLRPGMGSLYSLDTDGSVRELFDGVSISNGLAWSEDGHLMYYVDSGLQRIDVMDYDPDTGDVSGRRRWVEVGEEDGTPDGIAIDADGCLWVALWDGGKVRRYSPQGRVIGEIELPVPRVTACAFGGENLDRLFITTAAVGRESGSLDGALFVVDPGSVGVAPVVAATGEGWTS